MASRLPNQYNTRAAMVADALRDAATARNVSPAALTRAEMRAILQTRGLYTSEGSLSRDIAAVRRGGGAEFGGLRTAWAIKEVVAINGKTYVKKSIFDVQKRDLDRIAAVGVGKYVRWTSAARLAGDAPRVRAQLFALSDGVRAAARARLASQPRAPLGRGGGSPYCVICGNWTDTPPICDSCRAQIAAEYGSQEGIRAYLEDLVDPAQADALAREIAGQDALSELEEDEPYVLVER